MFERLQKAYDVLMDPTQRAIYDIYGEQGIDAGMELSPYIKVPFAQIRFLSIR